MEPVYIRIKKKMPVVYSVDSFGLSSSILKKKYSVRAFFNSAFADSVLQKMFR